LSKASLSTRRIPAKQQLAAIQNKLELAQEQRKPLKNFYLKVAKLLENVAS